MINEELKNKAKCPLCNGLKTTSKVVWNNHKKQYVLDITCNNNKCVAVRLRKKDNPLLRLKK